MCRLCGTRTIHARRHLPKSKSIQIFSVVAVLDFFFLALNISICSNSARQPQPQQHQRRKKNRTNTLSTFIRFEYNNTIMNNNELKKKNWIKATTTATNNNWQQRKLQWMNNLEGITQKEEKKSTHTQYTSAFDMGPTHDYFLLNVWRCVFSLSTKINCFKLW